MLHRPAVSSELNSTLSPACQTGALELNYCNDNKILHLCWSSQLTRQDLEYGYEVVFEYIKTFQPKKYLLDLHLREEILLENQSWFFETIIPKILQLTESTIFMAAIVPVAYYTNLTDEFNTANLPVGEQLLVLDHFLLPDMGLNWLKSLG